MPSRNGLDIKGIREGLLVHVRPDGDWPGFVKQLIGYIDSQQEFFKGARLVLEVGERALRRQDISTLQHMLLDRGVLLVAILSKNTTTMSTARKQGLLTALEPARPTRPVPPSAEAARSAVPETLLRTQEDGELPPPVSAEETGTAGVLVKRTLRSGRKIRSEGHVVVIGDVNPGAEIIAGGDVIVWGRLRGLVHAGAHGDETATVCALDMAPVQLRIAGHIATSPKEHRRDPRPEIAMIRDNRIVVESWN
ncbi:MAG: septum site-determining protein MinC [Anaerolineae bacterium]